MSETRSGHVAAIDRAKGIAIVFVVCIHAKIAEDSVFFEHVTNRAVPIFLVLFGVTSDLWWRRESGGFINATWRWFASRFPRLLVPYWGMAAAWWLAVGFHGISPMPLDGPHAVRTFAGLAPWIGTSWFVALILGLVLVFPLLEQLSRLPFAVTLPLTAALTAYSTWHLWDIIKVGYRVLGGEVTYPGWYYFWIFFPRVLFHVMAGMALARRQSPIPTGTETAICAAIAILGIPILEAVAPSSAYVLGPLRRQIAFNLLDVPLALALLGIVAQASLPGLLARGLEWCGRWSWGIYLGHLLVHELVHLRGVTPDLSPDPFARMGYGAVLLVLGALVAVAGAALRRAAVNTSRTLLGAST